MQLALCYYEITVWTAYARSYEVGILAKGNQYQSMALLRARYDQACVESLRGVDLTHAPLLWASAPPQRVTLRGGKIQQHIHAMTMKGITSFQEGGGLQKGPEAARAPCHALASKPLQRQWTGLSSMGSL
eukprot:782608-Pelagomonas_calceolata.AAC.2